MLKQGHVYRLKIKGLDEDIPNARYVGHFINLGWPAYRGPEPDPPVKTECFDVEGSDSLMAVIPDNILEHKDLS